MPSTAGDLCVFSEAVGASMKGQESGGFRASHMSIF